MESSCYLQDDFFLSLSARVLKFEMHKEGTVFVHYYFYPFPYIYVFRGTQIYILLKSSYKAQ